MPRKKKQQRAARGNGSIRLKENGKYEYRITYIDQFGKSRRKSFNEYSLKDCYDRCDEFLKKQKKMNAGIAVDATIPDLVEAHFTRKLNLNRIGPQGFYRNMETLEIIRRSPIGSIPIAKLSEDHIILFLASVTTYADSTIEKLFLQLKIAYDLAMNRRIIDTNLMVEGEIQRPKSKKPPKDVVSFTQEQQKRFLETLNTHAVPEGRNEYKKQLLIELYTGMRMGEINALREEDIDFNRKVIKVSRTVSLGEGSLPFINDTTKTAAGKREIPLTKEAEYLLREAIAESRRNPEGLIFYDHINKHIIKTNQVNSFFNRICEKAGLEIRGQHSLRHTFATRCIEADVPAVVLKKWMGHTDIHVTLDTYADVFDSMKNNAINKFQDHMETLSI